MIHNKKEDYIDYSPIKDHPNDHLQLPSLQNAKNILALQIVKNRFRI